MFGDNSRGRQRFLKANISVTVNEQKLDFPDRYITLSGVIGLPWGPLQPSQHFGLRVTPSLQFPEATLEVEAVITREHSFKGKTMGLKFVGETEGSVKLAEIFEQAAATRPDFVRQYPRIPSLGEIQTFPLHAFGSTQRGAFPEERTIAFEVRNLSLGGILVSTEDPGALPVRPGDRLYLNLQPRGGFPCEVTVYGYVCRITDEINPASGNIMQFLAIRFLNTSPEHRRDFLELLRDILRRIEQDSALATS